MNKWLGMVLCCICAAGCASHGPQNQQSLFAPLPPELDGTSAPPAPQPSAPPANTPSPAQPPTPAPGPGRLSDNDLRQLVVAANKLAIFGKAMPKRLLQKLHPVEIYRDGANVVIALQRNGPQERGYYIVPPTSSQFPSENKNGFTWDRVYLPDVSPVYAQGVYSYSRTR